MKSVLCDAVIVIDAHVLGLWNTIKTLHRIHVASAVLAESQHFSDGLHTRQYLDFETDISVGVITKISMPIESIKDVIKEVRGHKIEIHVGEAESIAALLHPDHQQLHFCTADRGAVVATHIFGIMSRVVPLEKCLAGSGRYTLPYKLTEKAMQNRQYTEPSDPADATQAKTEELA
ncbi:hypothetical protein IBX73_11310 [candidate division WOR-3 bacterium]|nr:hypothetical protein [candidate division WOR-3 bacterium]